MIERMIGSEEMLLVEDEDVLLCFGRGEPGAGGDFPARLKALLNVCDEVRAIRFGRQVHGNLIASLSEDASRPFSEAAEVGMCDGLITDEPGLGLALQTADCVPVLMWADGVAAAVHAGWRGIAAGIHLRAVRRFLVEYGVPASRLRVCLGPSVEACHYEVGREVIEVLAERGADPAAWCEERRVDLRALLGLELENCGLKKENIESVGPCTACDTGYASYRRDGESAGRQISLIVLRRK